MKYIKAFLLENELEDLRMDLMGLGYERWEVSLNGIATRKDGPNEWSSYEVWCKGVGDSKESAMRYALQALYESVRSGSPVHGVKVEWDGVIGTSELKDSGVMSLPDITSTGIEGEVDWKFGHSKELESYGNSDPKLTGYYYKKDGKYFKRFINK